VIVTCSPANLAALQTLAIDVPLTQIGTVGGGDIQIAVGDATVRLSIADARSAYESAIPEALM
jgi:hypothetical protein